MKAAQILRERNAERFQPFDLVLGSGASLSVPHPDYLHRVGLKRPSETLVHINHATGAVTLVDCAVVERLRFQVKVAA